MEDILHYGSAGDDTTPCGSRAGMVTREPSQISCPICRAKAPKLPKRIYIAARNNETLFATEVPEGMKSECIYVPETAATEDMLKRARDALKTECALHVLTENRLHELQARHDALRTELDSLKVVP